MDRDEIGKLLVSLFLHQMEENGFYFDCGTLVFVSTPVDSKGLHVVIQSRCEDV